MANDKLQKLVKYQSDIKSKLETKELPAKQASRGASYKMFLEKELKQVTAKIEAIKMAGVK